MDLVRREPDTTPTYIYNPLREDFKTTFAEDRDPKEYVIHSRELAKFPKYLAEHIGKKLVQKIALSKDSGISYDIREEAAKKEVFVEV